MRLRRWLPAFLLAVLCFPAAAEDLRFSDPALSSDIQQRTLGRFLYALRTGRVSVIRDMLDQDHYLEYRTLLEQNSTYPQFLRKFYAGSTFRLVNLNRKVGDYVADIEIGWPDGRSVLMSLQISESLASDNRRIRLEPR